MTYFLLKERPLKGRTSYPYPNSSSWGPSTETSDHLGQHSHLDHHKEKRFHFFFFKDRVSSPVVEHTFDPSTGGERERQAELYKIVPPPLHTHFQATQGYTVSNRQTKDRGSQPILAQSSLCSWFWACAMIFKLLILLLRLPSARITGKLSPFGNRLCLFSYDFSEDRILGCSLSILIPELLPLSSMSLHLGKEVYDICKTPLQDNRNHLFIREDTGLRGQAIFQSRLTFR